DVRVGFATFSPVSPALLATSSADCRIWNLETGNLLVRLPQRIGVMRSRFSSDGSELVTAGADGTLRVWDWRAGKMKDALPPHRDLLMDCRLTPDQRWLVTLGTTELQVTDWRTRTAVSPQWDLWKLWRGDSLALEVTPGGDRAIVGGFSQSLV